MFHDFIAMISTDSFNVLLFLGFILFLGALGGRLLQKIRFPQVVGYIVIGIILGQTGIGLISKSLINIMHPINNFALGIIGFMIGSELKIKVLKKYGRQFSIILLLESLTAFFLAALLTGTVAFLLFKDIKTAVSIGLLLGSIAAATAPAATTDVLWENKTKGPLTTIIFGLVAMDDGVALLLFAISGSIASVLLGSGESSLGMEVFKLVYEIGGALVLGSLLGFALSKLIRSFMDEDRILVFSVSSLLVLIGVSQVLHLNMILATMSMGFFISNFAPRKSKDTFKLIQKFSPPIYILFFVLVGAELNVSNISLVAVALASVYLIGRLAGKFLGAIIGARLSGAPATVKKYLGLCLLSQAGVAIGLSILAEKNFTGGVGDLIIIVITTTTFIVQLAGPPLVKLAAVKSGEAGLNRTEDDLLRESTAADLVSEHVPSIQVDTRIREVLQIFSEHDNLYYAVLDKNETVQGIITIDNLKSLIMSDALNDFLLAVDIMEAVPHTVKKDDPGTEIVEIMKRRKLPCLPVLNEKNAFWGMIEERSIEKYVSEKFWEMNKIAEALE